ncbi:MULTISPECIES: sigma-E factor negative regulatory protein [Gammaproteobacteria]|uniref:sigma-E factor negative regulatory protein n=1 Tax=Gammaproteobacteria TaxID=1236 RepID=UPI000DD0A395|nr:MULTISPECIES: RseA family anti-sigma factor [Gammaproteobacteria]RTE87104.1 hypothetical protein DQX04_01550 [Aliidiomarina sp. B3213]TCZ93108.1 hypothetical protein EYQ95_03755 [Lysobacter sp. N42]
MTKHQHEHLSGLTDDFEVTSESVDALVESSEQRETWARYHVLRSAIRGEYHGGPVDISAAVASVVEQEPPILAPNSGRKAVVNFKQWLKPAANVAVAASVALITVVGVMQYQRIDDGSTLGTTGSAEVTNQAATPVLQTMPLGGTINPVSYDAVVPQQSQYSEQDIERMRMRMQIQSYLQNHYMQVQSQQVSEPETSELEEEQNNP